VSRARRPSEGCGNLRLCEVAHIEDPAVLLTCVVRGLGSRVLSPIPFYPLSPRGPGAAHRRGAVCGAPGAAPLSQGCGRNGEAHRISQRLPTVQLIKPELSPRPVTNRGAEMVFWLMLFIASGGGNTTVSTTPVHVGTFPTLAARQVAANNAWNNNTTPKPGFICVEAGTLTGGWIRSVVGRRSAQRAPYRSQTWAVVAGTGAGLADAAGWRRGT
jgi:hypothetical protein